MESMTRRVTAIFAERADAEQAADALVDLGAVRHEISLLSRAGDAPAVDRHDDSLVEPAREVGDEGAPLTTTDEETTAEGAATGAAVGAVVGLTAGLATLLVPGFGLVLAAGPLAWALGGAAGAVAAGAVAGGVYGALRDLDIDETAARGYEERLRRGDVLLTARVPLLPEEQIRAVLVEWNAEDVNFAPAPGAAVEEEVLPSVPAPTTFPLADPAVGPTLPPPLVGATPAGAARDDHLADTLLDEEEEDRARPGEQRR
jgi:hypothetical protein